MRSKLKLDLDQLAVDSFGTADEATQGGTVFGEQCTCWTNCTCPGCPTCDHTHCGQHTCDGSCQTCHTCGGQYTCDYTCDCQTQNWVATCFNVTTCNWYEFCNAEP